MINYYITQLNFKISFFFCLQYVGYKLKYCCNIKKKIALEIFVPAIVIAFKKELETE